MRRASFSMVIAGITFAAASHGAGFVGSTVCRDCHGDVYAAWRGTHHDLAMQHADRSTVLGDFGDARYEYRGVESTFFRRDGRYRVRTDDADGKLAEFEVRFTFGVAPLQQYLIALPGGRLQALGVAWDSRPESQGGQRWFHLYPDQPVDHRHDLHWTGLQQNWNFMCASCHSTNVDKGYDPDSGSFETTWTDVDVGCEACHGPAGAHVAWAQEEPERRAGDNGLALALTGAGTPWRIDPATGSAVPRSGPATVELGVCADCHSRRSELAPAAETGARFLDHHRPALLTEGLYYPDGQIHDEVFVWGSFVQSRMHRAGVTCSDCHEPHSLTLRAPGDAVCAQCHLPSKFAVESHHHHPPGSAGAACLDCHMPETTYMVVDPRRDHSLRIPRPDESVALGTPNACNRCHVDRTAQWAAERYRAWYPDAAPGQQTWARTLASARAGDPRAEQSLAALVENAGMPAIARATALSELQPFLTPDSGPVLQNALDDDSALVRIAALGTLEALPLQHRHAFAGHLLSDPLLAVRAEAGRVLAGTPLAQLSEDDRTALRRAEADYVDIQRYHADRPESGVNLGLLHRQKGDTERAAAALRRALVLDAGYVPAYVNLAELLRSTGRDDEASALLREGIERQPDAAPLHYAVGLASVRAGDQQAGVESLARAVRLEPDDAHFSYVYAIALNSTGDSTGAVETLEAALEQHPYDRNLLLGLTTIHRDRGELAAARRYARRMMELRPADRDAAQLLRTLEPGPR